MARPPKDTAPTPPARFAETPPPMTYPSGDYSYTLEAVMQMQKTLGELTQAVKTLTEQSKEHGRKLDDTCKDVHAAKIVVGVLGAIGVGAATLIGFVAKAAIEYFGKLPSK